MPLPPASRLGPYEILALLSTGGMGEVYRARDTRLGRQVAVKVLADRLCTDEERLRRFQQEAQAASALNHPNVVSIFDVGSEDGVFFVVSELIEGETLRELLGGGPLPVRRARDIAAQVARGLAAAHERGVVHRDLKPENVMITRDGRVKILDFGVAKVEAANPAVDVAAALPTIGGRTLPGTLIGTIAYMSPEQVRGDAVDHRSDIFSFGTVLYEMVTGVRPFGGRTSAEILAAILRDDPPPLTGVPQGVQRLIRQCLEKTREDRVSSLDAVARALEQSDSGVGPGAAAAGVAPQPSREPGAADAERTVAVLPFTNVGPDPENEYFSDGLTEELIHELTRVRGLRVVAWNSASRMKGRADDVQAVARQLGVGAVLVGSVRRAGGRVRITVRLIDAASGYYLWSEAYDRHLQDLLAVQEEIARAIVGALSQTLALGRPAADSRRPGSVEAYNLYLKGRFFSNRRTSEGLWKSIECFEEAIAADEASALAHSGLADSFCLLVEHGFARPAEVMPRARQAALDALALDPRSAEAHVSLGLIRALYDWQWEEGEAFFRRALELSPGYATAHHWLAIDFLSALGRFSEAHEAIDRARQLDPLSLVIIEGKSYLHMLEGRHDEAIAGYHDLLELDATYFKGYTSLGRALLQKGEYREGIAMLNKGRAMVGDVPGILGALGQGYALAGEPEQARGLLHRLSEQGARSYVPSTSLALIHCGLGEYDRALDFLERSCELRELPITAIRTHPAYNALRGQPRFAALLRLIWGRE